VFGKKKKGEVGVDRLVDEGVFTAAFPLHDVSQKSKRFEIMLTCCMVLQGPYEIKKGSRRASMLDPSKLNARQVLYEYWARWGKWYKYQPLDHIREYFGEKIAIYFAWLGEFVHILEYKF
jgi:anoctamin-7